MFKAKYLLFSFLLLSVAFFAAGVETTSAQVAPRTHESCGTYSPLHNTYLRWGSVVACTPSVFEIVLDIELHQGSTTTGAWYIVDFQSTVCYDNLCIIDQNYYDHSPGDYRIKLCFSAESIQSAWPYECGYTNYDDISLP